MGIKIKSKDVWYACGYQPDSLEIAERKLKNAISLGKEIVEEELCAEYLAEESINIYRIELIGQIKVSTITPPRPVIKTDFVLLDGTMHGHEETFIKVLEK